MNFMTANTTNHRRIIMFVATEIFGIFTALAFYKISLTAPEFIIPPIIGLLIFELLYRTKKWLSLKTLPVYIILVTPVSHVLYSLFYSLAYGGIGDPLGSLQYLFSEFPYNLHFLIESSIVTGLAYYLIKIYRIESWVTSVEQSTDEKSNEPVFDEGPMTLNRWLQKNSQQIWGFTGWFALASLLAPVSFGLITTPVTIICVIAFGLSKTRKGIAAGILVAVSINFVISLMRGLQFNAMCFMPFYVNQGF